MTEVQEFTEFKGRVRRIADANSDELATTVTWDEFGYHLQIVETADNHVFMEVSAPTLTEVIRKADAGLTAACEDWDYEAVP